MTSPPRPKLLLDESQFGPAANQMVNHQLFARDIRDTRVLNAMRAIPRHLFVDPALQQQAYHDCPLPTLNDQTISQPYIVALMTQLLQLQGHENILEIGTGSGYQTAILAHLANHVTSIERIPELANRAQQTLHQLQIQNTNIITGDGTNPQTLNSDINFDRILVTAAAPDIPNSLLQKLKPLGQMVIPIGDRSIQKLISIINTPDPNLPNSNHTIHQSIDCRFVPLIGHEAWQSNQPST